MIFQLIILQVIVFGAIIYFLKKILYGNTENAVQSLALAHQELLNKQKDLMQKIETSEKEHQAKQEEMSATLDKMKMDTMEELRKKEDEITKKARAEAEEIIAKANAAKQDIYREIEAGLARRAVDYACELIKSVLSANSIAQVHAEMVKDFIIRAKDMDLSSVDASITEMVIRTALPMAKEETDKLQALLLTKLNRGVQLHEVVEPELIAGLILQFGTLVLDGCMLNGMREASNKMKEKV